MSLQALIFDVDGTLAETEEAHRAAFNDTFALTGLGWHWSQVTYTRLLHTTGGKERMRRYREEIGAKHPVDDAIPALHQLKTTRYAEIVARGGLSLRPGVYDLITTARAAGLAVAVATTTSRSNVEALCDAIWGQTAADVFDVIAAGDEVPAKKPAPDVYQLALDRLRLPPDRAIAIEDSRNGLSAARAAGLRVLVTPALYTRMECFEGADWVAPDLRAHALPEVIRSALIPAPAPARASAR